MPANAKLPQGYTVAEFCAIHNITRTTFYKYIDTPQIPKTITIGRRRIIPAEEYRAWRKRRVKQGQIRTEQSKEAGHAMAR